MHIEGVRSQIGFIAPIEGMRGIAVLAVMAFHYRALVDPRFLDPWVALLDTSEVLRVIVRNGHLGVDLFFVITGFLLVLPWLRHAAEGGAPPSATAFYLRRVRRILPAYYVHLLILFFIIVPLVRGLEFWRYNPTHMFANISAHAALVHYLSPHTSASVSVNGALWTLCLEAQFYLLLPLLAPVFARAPWRTATALFAVAFAWRWLSNHELDGLVVHLRSQVRASTEEGMRHFLWTQFPGYLGHFAAGMMAARAWLAWRDRPPGMAASVGWSVLAALALVTLWWLHTQPWPIDFKWPLILAALALAFVALVSRGVGLSRPALANAPLAFVGRVSFSAYLYHLPVLLLWNVYAPDVKGSWLVFPGYVTAVLAIAWLSYRRVEVPGMVSAILSPPSRRLLSQEPGEMPLPKAPG